MHDLAGDADAAVLDVDKALELVPNHAGAVGYRRKRSERARYAFALTVHIHSIYMHDIFHATYLLSLLTRVYMYSTFFFPFFFFFFSFFFFFFSPVTGTLRKMQR